MVANLYQNSGRPSRSPDFTGFRACRCRYTDVRFGLSRLCLLEKVQASPCQFLRLLERNVVTGVDDSPSHIRGNLEEMWEVVTTFSGKHRTCSICRRGTSPKKKSPPTPKTGMSSFFSINGLLTSAPWIVLAFEPRHVSVNAYLALWFGTLSCEPLHRRHWNTHTFTNGSQSPRRGSPSGILVDVFLCERGRIAHFASHPLRPELSLFACQKHLGEVGNAEEDEVPERSRIPQLQLFVVCSARCVEALHQDHPSA